MDAVLASTIDILEDVVKLPDWQSELAFTEPRHNEPITGVEPIDGTWRLRERVKTVSVALVLCLNVGVDPPDVVKIEPCAHLECWFDPLSDEPQKAIEQISTRLERQYEQWHSRARYKKCLDPTVDEVKRLCTSSRRYSKDDRVLFHYNGHGVPRPTQNGEIWVFNEKYTQYIPLPIYELQQWMGAPSIYVFDCSCAGSIVDSYLEFAKQHKNDYLLEMKKYEAHQEQLLQATDRNHTHNLHRHPNEHHQQQHPKQHSNQQLSNSMILDNNNGSQVQTHQNGLSSTKTNTPAAAVSASATTTSTTNTTTNTTSTTNTTLTSTNGVSTKHDAQQHHPAGNDNRNPTSDQTSLPPHNIRPPPIKPPDYENCFQLAACEAHQILPMQPDLPADLFTSCLTTPIKMALRWFIQKNDLRLIPRVTLDLIDKIPGNLSDRRTMLGELNWIFTAITDTIAWDVLPRDLFQRLYRQDLLVASLFRNYLLADRIMRTYDCTPVSHPKLPKTYHHPMWRAWDMVVDLCLSQLVDVLEDRAPFRTSTFFAEQLTAFEVWLDLDHSSNQHPDHQLLPIILQVLLSPVHRLRALDLLSRFLNLGPSAVNSALSVGIFPYVLKLLQSNAREVRPFLLSIWAKILAVDRRCQVDLVRDRYHIYFLNILSDMTYDAHYRTMAAFVMTCIVRDHPPGQEVSYQANLIAFCLEQLDDADPMLRKWLAICLGTSWDNYEDARWCGVRSCAHEKLYSLLDDVDPEVRAAAVFALGTFINSSTERSDHANTIDHSIGMKLVTASLCDSSVLVRLELVVALQYLVLAFESQFLKLEQATREEERKLNDDACLGDTPPSLGSTRASHNSGFLSPTMQFNRPTSKNYVRSHENYQPLSHGTNLVPTVNNIPRVNSLNAIPIVFGSGSKIVSNVYHIIWRAMYTLAADAHPKIANSAQLIIDEIRSRSFSGNFAGSLKESKSNSSISESSSPHTAATFSISESPPSGASLLTSTYGPNNINRVSDSKEDQQREWRMLRVLSYKNVCLRELMIVDPSRFNENIASYKVAQAPDLVVAHPYDPILIVAGKDEFSIMHLDGPHANSYEPGMTNSSSTSMSTGGGGGLNTSISSTTIPASSMAINNSHYGQVHYHPHHHHHSQPFHIHNNHYQQQQQHLQHHHHHHHHGNSNTISINNYSHHNNTNGSHDQSLVHSHAHLHDLIGTQSNCYSNSSHITSLQLINPQYNTLICTGSSEGSVRIWRAYNGLDYTFNPQLVTAFHLMPELQPYRQGLGMILLWDQLQSRFYATSDQSDVRIIKVWDATSESKVQDIPTCAEFGVSCLTSDGEHSIAAGFLDGSIRIYDTRLKKTDCRTFTFRKHSERILGLHMFKPGEKHINLVSGDTSGEVRFWDKRAPTSVKRVDVGQKMNAMSVHPNADVFACGLRSGQGIKIYNLDGTSRAGCVIKCQDNNNFFTSRQNPSVSCMAFHPLKSSLIAGYTDSVVSVYSSRSDCLQSACV